MVFGVIVAEVFGSRTPVNEELFLVYSVFDPVESHVDGFGSFMFDCVIREAFGGGVVHLHGGWWLRMTDLFQGGSNGDCLLAIDVRGTDFGFSRRAHDVAHDTRDGEEWSIGLGSCGWGRGGQSEAVAEKVMSTGSTAGLRFGEIAGVTVDVEDHVRCVEAKLRIGMGGGIIKKLVHVVLG